MKPSPNTIVSLGAAFSLSCTTGITGDFNNQHISPPRNLVFILIDDLGIQDLGCYGSDYYETPNCDLLAAQGMRFTEAYAAHPVCSPTRASLMTGRYPARLHLTAYIPGQVCPNAKLKEPDWIKYLRKSEFTYAEVFREAGYATCHIGKWHLGTVNGPGEHGFETVTAEKNPVKDRDPNDPWFVDYYTTALEKFLEENKSKPFLAVLSHGTVHVPLHDKEDLIAKYRSKNPGKNGQDNPVMGAMIERMDQSVGRVMKKLKELDLEKNTAVIFFSDNGGLMNVLDEETGKTVTATSNRPYRGGKSQLYEGGIRVPLIIRCPGISNAGSLCDFPVISTDLYPSMLDMAGIPLRQEQHLDGFSLLPLLKGEKRLSRLNLFWHYPQYQTLPPHSAIRSGTWKLIHHYENKTNELFNLSVDPSETNNLADKEPGLAEKLQKILNDHLVTIGGQFPQPNPGYNPDVPWRQGSKAGSFDKDFEAAQETDPRQYVTDPFLDYGAYRKPE
jgi:arylsulfatase A-like enzyme